MMNRLTNSKNFSDVFQYISGHFDTEVGSKQEADSYKNILKKIDHEAKDVLFLTDVVKGMMSMIWIIMSFTK